jgi:hypothetical protein
MSFKADKMRHNHMRPHAPGNKQSSTGIRPVTTSHSNSTTKTRIFSMITLTSDKLTLIKAGFCDRTPLRKPRFDSQDPFRVVLGEARTLETQHKAYNTMMFKL